MENGKIFTLKKLKKQAKGITLIALVVTIIVLLILAGIALNLTIGQNGIFSRAQTAANTWRNAETNEQLAMNDFADLIDNYTNQKENEIDASTVSKNPTLFYGKPITNYTNKNGDIVDCQIFYADSNIYLIMTNLAGYGSRSDVKVTENNPAYKWTDSYLSLYPDKNDNLMQRVNYLLDINEWADYVGENADYAIGAPTIELFAASYNQTHPDNKIEYKVEENNDKGYFIKFEQDEEYSTGLVLVDNLNGIYSAPNYQQTFIASLTAQGLQDMPMVLNMNFLDSFNPTTGPKCRPVICLNENVKLIDNGDGSYSIK